MIWLQGPSFQRVIRKEKVTWLKLLLANSLRLVLRCEVREVLHFFMCQSFTKSTFTSPLWVKWVEGPEYQHSFVKCNGYKWFTLLILWSLFTLSHSPSFNLSTSLSLRVLLSSLCPKASTGSKETFYRRLPCQPVRQQLILCILLHTRATSDHLFIMRSKSTAKIGPKIACLPFKKWHLRRKSCTSLLLPLDLMNVSINVSSFVVLN